MRYAVTFSKSAYRAGADLRGTFRQKHFGAFHQYNLKKTLAGKDMNVALP